MRAISFLFVALTWLVLCCPTASTAEKLLGLKMEEAKKADFFTFFNLGQTEKQIDAAKHTVLTFKPAGEMFRELVTVHVTLDKEDGIHRMQVTLARSFIDDRVNGIFARDIAKSLLRSTLSEKESAKISDLVNEIQWGFGGMVIGRQKPPKLPDPPTPGYLAFLGKRDSFEADLGKAKLQLRQQKNEKTGDALIITVELKD